jgi:RNA polymerase sigma factor (sigma-70 family)
LSPLIINGRTEKDLIFACLQGERQAQKEIFQMYAPKMMAICLRYAPSKQEAEDILQDSFVKVFTHLQDFSFQGSFEGWVRRIIVNTAIRHCQKAENNVSIDQVADETTDPEVFNSLSEDELINIISSLPDGYRVVFNLYAIEGYNHREISQMLNVEESTSRSQLFKARKMLQDMIAHIYQKAV